MLLEIMLVVIIAIAAFIGLGGILAGGTLEFLGGAILVAGIGTVIASRDPLLIGLMLLLFLKKLAYHPRPKNEFDYHGGSYPWYVP